MNKIIRLSFIIALLVFASQYAQAQCRVTNTAFKSGEKITYDLYYKYGIINAKAGRGTLTTTSTNLAGKSAFKTRLLANTSGVVGNMYTVNDTLTGYVDTDMVPLLFTKETFEGSDYATEKQSYSYNNGTVNVRAIRYWKGKLSFDEVVTTNKCSYDYVSVINYARNLDFSNMKPGDNTPIQFLSGKTIVNMYIRYMGTKKVKVNNGKTYDAVQLSLMIIDKAFADQEEAMSVALTNDLNRLPLVIEIGLKMGSMRVVLKDYEGIRHPID
ncbi:MAG: DUF3108 domain-containing protein [Petrimonas sp.]|nr:DUF3108 domain-containing protein [Petrimonas sp.]